MAEFTTNGAAVEGNENRENPAINSDIVEFMKLRQSVESSNKTVQHWMGEMSKLLESNKNIEINYNKLMLKVSDIDEQMSDTMKVCIGKKRELEDLKNARTNLSNEQWDNCLSKVGKYADHFCQWLTDYSNNVLTKDIENYREEREKVSEALVNLKQEVDDMIRAHDIDYVEANTDIDELSNLDIVTANVRRSNNNLTYTVRSTENSLEKLQNKVEQSKIEVKKYKAKEGNIDNANNTHNNMF